MTQGIHITPAEEAGRFYLSGAIDAHLDLSPLFQTPPSRLLLHLKEIQQINSIGIKKWIELTQRLQQQGKTIECQECPPLFIRQCNFVQEFHRFILISSFQVAFVCEDCGQEVLKLLKRDELDLDDLPPDVPCPSCQIPMITESEDVFNFLQG